MVLFVEKKLPVLLNGNISIIILIIDEYKIKSSIVSILKNLKFFKIKNTKNNKIVNNDKIPIIPVSVKISK